MKNQACSEVIRIKRSVDKRAAKKRSANGIFNYDSLEPRRLLAVASSSGVDDVTALQTDFLATSDVVAVGEMAGVDVTPKSNLVTVLENKLPVSEVASLLREHISLAQNDTMWLSQVQTDHLGFEHLKYRQLHHGLPVEHGEFTLHIRNDLIESISGNYVPMIDPIAMPELTQAMALESALEYVDADVYAWEGETPTEHSHEGETPTEHSHEEETAKHSWDQPRGELVYVSTGDSNSRLTYKFDIYATAPMSRAYVFVDAVSGEIVDVQDRFHEADVAATGTSLYNGTVNFIADSNSGSYRLRQSTNGVETYDLNNGTNYSNATDITSSNTSFTANSVHTGVQAHFGAEQTLEYFQTEHSRDSYDDQGTTLVSYVSYSSDYVNAFWNGSYMTYGDGNGTSYNPLVSLDIVGHEITHGVTEYSANLVYSYESGALNESFSDIFGEAIENFALGSNDWLMGEDIGVNPGNALRSMSNPSAKGDPDTYLGSNWNATSSDNGGVHTNSGVQNKWFYILTEGEAGVNDNGQAYDVAGIGINDAAEIAYRNLSVYLTTNSQYIDAREGAAQSAIDLFGANSQQHLSTIAAWDAVGVGGSFAEMTVFEGDASGAGINRSILNGDVIAAGLPDTIAVSLDPNQTLSIAVRGSNGLIPEVEVRDPNNVLVGNGTAINSNLSLPAIDLVESGTYQILIDGASNSSGDYQVEVVLNAVVESESVTGVGNNDLANAENLDAAARFPGTAQTSDRIAVLGDLAQEQIVVASDGFESGGISGDWVTSSTDSGGRIVVTNSFAANGSVNSLFMDQTNTGTYNLNEAVYTVDLSGAASPTLSFYHAEWGDETDSLPASFSGSSNGDGVAISADGTNWHTVLTNTDSASGVWDFVEIDLAAEASSAGISLGSNFKLKFQQYDNYPYDSDGRAYDEINIYTEQASPDWYAFSVADGQQISIGVDGINGSATLALEIFDSNGALLATGIASSNYDSALSSYTNTGGAVTLYAQVTGTVDVDYALVISRSASLDIESASPQVTDLTGLSGVLGFVSTLSSTDADPDGFAAETNISNSFSGLTLSNNVGSGAIYAASASFGAPTGANVYAPGATASNGFRAGDDELRADFSVLQSTVSIDVGSDDSSDVAWLRAYDSSNNLLAEAVSGSIASGGSETLTISRPSADIAYVISAGKGTDITPLDNLVYQISDLDDDLYSITASAGDQFSIDAFLPGAGVYLFNNAIDGTSGSELQMEVRDPSGTLVASDSTSIFHTASTSGDYEVRVFANAGLGEYFIEQWFNHAPIANSESILTAEDDMVNIDVVANDDDVDGDTFFVASVGSPAHGVAELKSNGTIDYTPFDDFYGSDSFVYVLEDEHGATTEGVVPVSVTPVNDAPTDIDLSSNSVNENTDTTGGLVVGTLLGVDVDTTVLTYNFLAGAGDDDNSLFEIDGDSLKIKSGVELDFETKSQYSILVEVSDGEFTFDKALTIDVADQLEMDALVFDSSSEQMSSIRQISVSFPELVTIDSGAFSFMHRGSGNSVGYNMSQSDATGKTVVTFSFVGAGVTHGSLDDGNYQMSIDGGKVQSNASGSFLDGDSDGTEGGTLVFGDQESDGFFRLFGDSDGDRDVDNVDLARFLNTYRESSDSSDYNESMDYDLDGDVDNVDLANYLQRYYTSLPFG